MIYHVLDDLNSLYVYEAKMSLFIRIAQTRQGAERLVESRVLPILADCDFLDTLPEADQSFIGMPCGLLCYWWLI
jgi:nuclear pore complex protein Nup205